jgi:hypothetical protein
MVIEVLDAFLIRPTPDGIFFIICTYRELYS